MLTQPYNTIPALTKSDIAHYVATHEFNEIGDQRWFRLVPHGEETFRTKEYGFFSGQEFTTGDILWIAVGLNKTYQTRPYAADLVFPLPVSVAH